MKKINKGVIYGFVFGFIAFVGITYASQSITNINQTAVTGDRITAAWVNDVNSKMRDSNGGGFFGTYQTVYSGTARINDFQHCFIMEDNGFISVTAGGVGRLYVNGTLVGYNVSVGGRDHDGNHASQVTGVARKGDNVCARTSRAVAGYNAHIYGGDTFLVQVSYWR